jgi:hypothetical protein
MVGILVNYYLVRIPKPIIAKGKVVGGNTKVEPVKPKTLPVSSAKPEDMARAEPAREVPMLPRMIEVVVRVTSARIMPHPLSVRMDVRGVGVPGLIAKIAILRRGGTFTPSRGRTTSRNVGAISLPSPLFPSLRKNGNGNHQQQHKKADVFFHICLRIGVLKRLQVETQQLNFSTLDYPTLDFSTQLRLGNAAHQVELLAAALGAYRKGIQHAK